MNESYYKEFFYPVQVEPLPEYCLAITFTNGERRIFDVKPYLEQTFWAPLKDPLIFESVSIDGSVCWSDSLDIAPEELWHNSKAM